MYTKIIGILASIGLLLFIIGSSKLFEHVSAEDNVVIQSPVEGKLSWYTKPGLVWQGFGVATHYPKRSIYEFEKPMRFNDGAHGILKGSIQYEMPEDDVHLNDIHYKFGSPSSLQKQLVQTVVDKAVYMTGPLMSSKESYAEKRNQLIWFVEDQINWGVYKTIQKDTRIKDDITGQEKTITVVEIVTEGKTPQRQEEPVLAKFGIRTFNFSITELQYEKKVEEQIAAQQQAIMDIQTAMANSKKADQEILTVEKQGQAKAATAKWEQEAIKAKAVTQAQQEKEVADLEAQKKLQVAQLAAQEAEQYKIAQIKRAEGDAAYKQKTLEADNGFVYKLQAWQEVNKYYADSIAKYNGQWVPSIVMGNSNYSSPAGNGAQALIEMLTAKTAKELGLSFSGGK